MRPSSACLVIGVVLASACGAAPSSAAPVREAVGQPAAVAVVEAAEPVLPATPLGDGWFVFATEPGVRLHLPAPPRSRPHDVRTPVGALAQRRFDASAGAVTFQLTVSELPDSVVTQVSFAEIFQVSREAALAFLAESTGYPRSGVHEGFPAQRMWFTGPVDGELLMVVAGRRLVHILATAPQGQLDGDAVERVFASLHVSEGACAHDNAASAPVQVARAPQVGAGYRVRGEYEGLATGRLDLDVTIAATTPKHVELEVVFNAFPSYGQPPAGATPGLKRRVLVPRGGTAPVEWRVQGGDAIAEYMQGILDSYDLGMCELPTVAHAPGDAWKWPENGYFTSRLLGVVEVDGVRWASFAARGPEIVDKVEPSSLNFPAVVQRVRVDDGFVGRCAIELAVGDGAGLPTWIVHVIEVERVR